MHADSCKSLSIIYDICSSSMPVHITSRYANMIQKAEEMSIKLYNSSHIYLPISILMIKSAQICQPLPSIGKYMRSGSKTSDWITPLLFHTTQLGFACGCHTWVLKIWSSFFSFMLKCGGNNRSVCSD